MRVAVLTEIISPYRIPLLNRLAEYPDIDLTVIFLSETERLREWRVEKEKIRFKYEVLPGRVVTKTYQNGSLFLNPSIVTAISRGNFETVVIGGYHHPSYWLALAYCRLRRKTTVLWSESTSRDKRSGSRSREMVKRGLISVFDRYVVPGTAQRSYLEEYGVNPSLVWIAPNAVDSAHFEQRSVEFAAERNEIRGALGLSGVVILFVGRIIDEKGVQDLLRAFQSLVDQGQVATLLIVGGGRDEQKYREYAKTYSLPVVFAGFQQQEDLPKFYAAADIFVLPTHSDPWGLVINEAMACGLPIIASSAAGAVQDMVHAGENGYVHEPQDVVELARHLNTLMCSPEQRERMGKRSREIIRSFTPELSAAGFRDAILEMRHKS
ncbi:MAG: glycosyltransferase family 4 protein [Chloroflexi bacterium]|nr:glycosyltransferase family 4 protein [Chloroflexota bacterium]